MAKTTPKKVMVIDDDAEFLGEMREMLIHMGYDVTALDESAGSVKVARAVKPDVMLVDLRMRSLSGFEVADALKRYPETEKIPVIAMTGFYTLEEHSWLMNFCGIEKCLKKPFGPAEVISEIERILKPKS